MSKKLLLVALLCVGSLAFAQTTQVAKKECTHWIPKVLSDEGIWGIAVPCEETYRFYYDENDNKIKHGVSQIEGKYKMKNNGVTIDEKFSSTCNYSNGELSGAIKQSYSILMTGRGESIEISWSFSGAYDEGLPDGTWVYSEVNKTNRHGKKDSSNDKCTVVFDKGKLLSVTNPDGAKIQVDQKGNVTGDRQGFKLKNNVATNRYIRRNGDEVAVDAEQLALINSYISGEYEMQYFIDKGYEFSDWNSSRQYPTGVLDFFNSRVGSEYYVDLGYLGGSFDTNINDNIIVLHKINLATIEEVKEYITDKKGEIIVENLNELQNNGWNMRFSVNRISTDVKSQALAYVNEKLLAKRKKVMNEIASCSSLLDLNDAYERLIDNAGFSEDDIAMIDSVYEKRKQEIIPVVRQRIINNISMSTTSEGLNTYYSREKTMMTLMPVSDTKLIESTYLTKLNELQAEEEKAAKKANRVKKIKSTVGTIVGVAVIVGGYLGYRYLFKKQ